MKIKPRIKVFSRKKDANGPGLDPALSRLLYTSVEKVLKKFILLG
tara:strand:+ start:455 stop:589 length:135 start_codon:yes stop_codon:yes gene_type:complete